MHGLSQAIQKRGLPRALLTDNGAAMVAEDNVPFIAAPGDEGALGQALARLAADPGLRQTIGAANQVRVRKEYDEKAMIERYKSLYWGLMGRKFA